MKLYLAHFPINLLRGYCLNLTFYFQFKKLLTDYAETSDSDQVSNPEINTHASQNSEINFCNSKNDQLSETCEPHNSQMMFEETDVSGEKYCLIPKHLAQYVPAKSLSLLHLDGIGHIEVGNEYIYISSSLLPKVTDMIDNQLDLQDEGEKCRTFLQTKCRSGDVPPFDPESMKRSCQDAGANKLLSALMHTISNCCHSKSKQDQPEKKCVTSIHMLMYGQSQKASCKQKVLPSQVVGQGINEAGLTILNKSGIAMSKTTQ